MSFHAHQHSVKVVATAESFDTALTQALSGLTDPKGHNARLAFQSFEVVKIGGRIDVGGSPLVAVTVEAFGSHRG